MRNEVSAKRAGCKQIAIHSFLPNNFLGKAFLAYVLAVEIEWHWNDNGQLRHWRDPIHNTIIPLCFRCHMASILYTFRKWKFFKANHCKSQQSLVQTASPFVMICYNMVPQFSETHPLVPSLEPPSNNWAGTVKKHGYKWYKVFFSLNLVGRKTFVRGPGPTALHRIFLPLYIYIYTRELLAYSTQCPSFCFCSLNRGHTACNLSTSRKSTNPHLFWGCPVSSFSWRSGVDHRYHDPRCNPFPHVYQYQQQHLELKWKKKSTLVV